MTLDATCSFVTETLGLKFDPNSHQRNAPPIRRTVETHLARSHSPTFPSSTHRSVAGIGALSGLDAPGAGPSGPLRLRSDSLAFETRRSVEADGGDERAKGRVRDERERLGTLLGTEARSTRSIVEGAFAAGAKGDLNAVSCLEVRWAYLDAVELDLRSLGAVYTWCWS